jgi:2,5-diketo-D-gluconate reductase A
MPLVGFGTYLIKDVEAKKAVYTALSAGYKHIDTAEGYGNEKGVSQGIILAMDELGIKREDIFITTKLWPGNASFETTIESFNKSLQRLQLDYIDLYLIHAPFNKNERLEQWRALVELKQRGVTKAIGVSNFNEMHIEEIKTANLPIPEANQIELHPWSQKPELVSYLKTNSISIIAYSSLVPLSSWRVAKGQKSAKTEEMKAEAMKEDNPFKIMAKKYGVSEAQVLLRWGLQKGYAILPKSTNEERIKQNINLFHFEIDQEDMTAISKMDRGEGVAWSSGDPTKAP